MLVICLESPLSLEKIFFYGWFLSEVDSILWIYNIFEKDYREGVFFHVNYQKLCFLLVLASFS